MIGKISKRGNTWSTRVNLPKGPDGRRHQPRITGKTKREVEEKVSDLMSRHQRGLYVPDDKRTVGEYLTEWLASRQPHLAPSTFRNYGQTIKLHLIPGLGNIRLGQLQPMQVEAYLTRQLNDGRKDNKKSVGKGLTSESVAYQYRVLRVALNQAVKWGLLATNPVLRVQKPRVERKRPTIPGEPDVAKLLTSLRGTYLFLPAFLAAHTGMRLGEILGLPWSAVDPDSMIIKVVQASYQRNAGCPAIGKPKTKASERTIDIGPVVGAALRKHRKIQAQRRLVAGADWNPFGLVICGDDGRPVNPPSLSSAFRKAAKRAGVDMTFHQLRHFHASLLIRAGTPMKVISERLGHGSISFTMDVYGHLLPGMQKEAALRAEKLMKQAGLTA